MSRDTYIIASLKAVDLPALGPHRHREGWNVAMESDELWLLRIPDSTSNSEHLRKLPCLERWHPDASDRLIPLGHQLPNRTLPTLSWLPLHTMLPAIPTPSQTNEEFFGHITFSLIEDEHAQEAQAIRLPLESFTQWAETAPSPRLERLRFAVSDRADALVIGTPLPPLQAETFYLSGSLLIPCGYALPAHILPHYLESRNDHYLLIEKDNTSHLIGSELCVPASRSAIRLTSQTFS